MNKLFTLIAACTIAGCATTAAHQTFDDGHPRCDEAYSRIKAEGPALERDLRDCLHGGLDRGNPECLDSRRFAAFSRDSHLIRVCVDSGLLRPPIHEARATAENLKNIGQLAGTLGDMAAARGL